MRELVCTIVCQAFLMPRFSLYQCLVVGIIVVGTRVLTPRIIVGLFVSGVP
jgi:hypothetical protein